MIFRRGKSPGARVPEEGQAYCDLCGEVVSVGVDGRCGLGHRATAAAVAWIEPDAEPEGAPETGPATAPEIGPDAPESPRGTGAGSTFEEEPQAPADPEITEVSEDPSEEDPFADLYGTFGEETGESRG